MPATLALYGFLARLAILCGICILTYLLVLWGRRFAERRRQRILNTLPNMSERQRADAPKDGAAMPVRILAFSSADCRSYHTLQRPALLRVAELRADSVTVVTIDAPSSPELMERYQVLTVPATVVLDATGKIHAVNNGFTNAQKLLQQVDAVVAQGVMN